MIGENIKILRKEKKLSLRALAELAGISKSTLSDVENENTNPSLVTVGKIANALGFPVSELLTVEEQLNITITSITKIAEMAKKGLNYKNSTDEVCESRSISMFDNFRNENFSESEENEITNFINFVISKRK